MKSLMFLDSAGGLIGEDDVSSVIGNRAERA
jgi:hypothetical protein